MSDSLVLVVTLVMYLIGNAYAIIYKNSYVHFANGLLWFVPIILVPNAFITTFSVIMFLISMIQAFYQNKNGDDF